MLSSFFYGYMVTQIPGGWLAGRFGGKMVIWTGMLIVATANLLLPELARVDYRFVYGLRALMGLAQVSGTHASTHTHAHTQAYAYLLHSFFFSLFHVIYFPLVRYFCLSDCDICSHFIAACFNNVFAFAGLSVVHYHSSLSRLSVFIFLTLNCFFSSFSFYFLFLLHPFPLAFLSFSIPSISPFLLRSISSLRTNLMAIRSYFKRRQCKRD